MSTRKRPRVSRRTALERLEERVNLSNVSGMSVPTIDTTSLIPMIENDYATFANSIRTAETTLLGKTPATPSTVAAQADQAAAQLNAQLNSIFAQNQNGAAFVLPVLQAQLTAPSASLMSSLDNIFGALGSTQSSTSDETANLTTAFQATEFLMAQSFSSTSTDLFFFANNQNSGGFNQNGSNLGQALTTIQNNFATFANSVRQAETTLGGTSPATPATVSGQIQQFVGQLAAQNTAVFQGNTQASNSPALNQAAAVFQLELTGAGPSLSNLMTGLINLSPASGSTGTSDPAIRAAAIEGLMAASYQQTVGNLFLLTIPSSGNRAGGSVMASASGSVNVGANGSSAGTTGNVSVGAGGSAALTANGSGMVTGNATGGTMVNPMVGMKASTAAGGGSASVSSKALTGNNLTGTGGAFQQNTAIVPFGVNGTPVLQNNHAFPFAAPSPFINNIGTGSMFTGGNGPIFPGAGASLFSPTNVVGAGGLNGSVFTGNTGAVSAGMGGLNAGAAAVPIASGGAAGFTTGVGFGTTGLGTSGFFNNIGAGSMFNGGNGPIFPGAGSSLFSPTNVVGAGGLNSPTFLPVGTSPVFPGAGVTNVGAAFGGQAGFGGGILGNTGLGGFTTNTGVIV